MVDEMMAEVKRPDMLTDIVRFTNATIRELHSDPETGAVLHFRDNFREEQLTATAETGFTWTIPNLATFQGIRAVRFSSVWNDDKQAWAKEIVPGRNQEAWPYRYYRGGDTVAFSEYGGLNAIIDLAWYEYPRSLIYYDPTCRPCHINDYGFEYFGKFSIHEHDRENARCLCTNWLLRRWTSLIEEGLRAKIYKRLADPTRSSTSYSLYMQQRKQLITAEIADGQFV